MGRLIRLDWAIKKILRDKANFDILEGFLSELLHFDVTIQEILESESNRDVERNKHNRVDLLVKDENDRLMIIEIQNESEADYLHRLMYGTSKVMVEHIQAGAPYSAVKKVYSVSIVYFDLGHGDDYLYHGTTNFTGLRRNDRLQLTTTQKELFHAETPAELFPEYYLVKVPKYDNKVRDTLDEWIYFLKNETIEKEFQAKGLQAAREKLDILKMDEDERRAYNNYLEDLRYQASMVLSTYGVGHHEGRKEERAEILRNMVHNLGFSIEDAAKAARLSPDEARTILDEDAGS
ncbi:MAG: Rpn family recombination-promoting nuclease/putative transposase [Acidobacteriota bacterium]|nr:Rpn family recombination-promoting nuclease/putative transposase [Acidobacteriota bacterium]